MSAIPPARILVIDDEEYFRLLLSNLFEEGRVEVVSCARGQEGLERLERERFDLIVVDYQLPDMLGLQILEWLRDNGVDTPRVMVTAYGSIDVAVQALKTGAADFFTKPLKDPAAFVRFLNRILSFESRSPERANILLHAQPPQNPEESAHPESDFDVGKVRALCAKLTPSVELSRREYEVVAALLKGLSNKEIAGALYISERTVKNHLTAIYRKFEVDGRSQLFHRILTDLA